MRYWPVRVCRHRQLFLPLLVLRLNVPFLRSSVSMSMSSRTPEIMQVKRLSENAILPVRGSEWAAGYDLSSAEDTVVPARGKALVKTDLSIAIPINTYARIAPRSGLAWKHFIDVGAGVVDYDYRGPVGVVLFNHGPSDFAVKKGDRVAQLILERIAMADVVEVSELSETARGAGGFGSTGVSQGTEDSNSGIKRLKQSVEGPADGDGVAASASLLTLLSELSKKNQGRKDVVDIIHKCKPLALAGDSRLLAAKTAYSATENEEDLIDTLKVISEGANYQ